METWKSLNGLIECGEYFEISNLGNVRSIDRSCVNARGQLRFYKSKPMKQFKDKEGYMLVTLCYHGKKYNFRVHRLVALAFIPNPENKLEVNHKDCNKQDNSVDNLEWMTGLENIQHATAKGLYKKK